MNWLIEQNLYLAQKRFKWLLFGKRIGTAGSALCLAWFFIQIAALYGVFTHKWIYDDLVMFMSLASMAVFVVILLISLSHLEKRSRLAAALEKSSPPLMDRMNTLVYLEGTSQGARLDKLRTRIEEQAAKLFEKEKPSAPFSAEPALRRLGTFFLLLVGVVLFQEHYHPFRKLVTDSAAVTTQPSAPFELPPQRDVSETQAKKTWGEVRIVDPGHDVRLTKVDVLPLQIEMTTSDSMEKPVWVTSVDGGEETSHNLAAPSDPNYMVYQPLVYLDQLKVSEWDVISYYAKVQTAAPDEYTSPLSFIEIRPFREDILKMTGGKDGQKNNRYQLLSELTGLIKQQTNLLQQTHQHMGTSYANNDLRLQDARKLSQGEGDLSTATDHFFGKIASQSENTPVGPILDELSQAEEQMNRAVQELQDDVAADGKQQEQGALTHLIACRKAFQKVISDHPDAFLGDSAGELEDEPTATDSLKALSQVSEMHDHDQTTLRALHQVTERQQSLALTAGHNAPDTLQKQMQIKSDLHDLMNQNPDLFRRTEPEAAAVQKNMVETIMKLSSADPTQPKASMTSTIDSLKDLEKAVNKNHEAQQLAQAYQLKKIIDQNARELSQEKQKPGSLSDEEAKNLADSAERSTATLKDIVDNQPGSSFGPKLGQALSASNQQSLDNSLAQVGNSPGGPGRSAAASEAQNDLQGISQAFNQSQPDLTRQIRGQDQLLPGPGEALDQATQQLQSLIMAAESQHPSSPEDQSKALAQVVGDLHAGMDDAKFGGVVHDKLLADADDLLKQKVPGSSVDPVSLKKLLDEIETVRIEANYANQPKPPELDTTQIDPSKFPPSYHDRLQNYFKQLSEQPH